MFSKTFKISFETVNKKRNYQYKQNLLTFFLSQKIHDVSVPNTNKQNFKFFNNFKNNLNDKECIDRNSYYESSDFYKIAFSKFLIFNSY